MDLLVYVPANAAGPVPLLLNLGFSANSSTVNDPGVKVGEVWGRDKKKIPAGQGMNFGKVNVTRLLDAGFGFATVYYGDIDPDFLGGVPFRVRALYLKPGQTAPAPDEWGSIAAWAWGLSRAMDYLETDKCSGREARGDHGCVAVGQDRDVGRRARSADRAGDRELLGRRRRGVEPPELRRDHRTLDRAIALSLSVLPRTMEIRQQGRSVPGGRALAGRADRTASSATADGRQGFLVGPEGRISGRGGRWSGVSLARQTGPGYGQMPPAGTPILHTSATTCMPADTAPSPPIGISIWRSCRCTWAGEGDLILNLVVECASDSFSPTGRAELPRRLLA